MREKDIRFEIDGYYVADIKDGYAVYVPQIGYAVSHTTYPHNNDGLSLAVNDCVYRALIKAGRRSRSARDVDRLIMPTLYRGENIRVDLDLNVKSEANASAEGK